MRIPVAGSGGTVDRALIYQVSEQVPLPFPIFFVLFSPSVKEHYKEHQAL